MVTLVRNISSNKSYDIPTPQISEKPSLIAQIKAATAKILGAENKSTPSTSFIKSVKDFTEHQKKIETFRASFDPENDSLKSVVYASRRTNIDEPLLKKITACVAYLEQNTKPKKTEERFQRYKTEDLSFTLHWKEKKLVSFILHLKKKKREDYKSFGTFSKVSKAVEFFPEKFRFLAECCNGKKEEARPEWINYNCNNVLAPPVYRYSYKGSRTTSSLEGETKIEEKKPTKKNVSFTEFLELDLMNLLNNSKIESPKFLLHILIKVATGLKSIHNHHPYRDLKLENIMLSFTESLTKVKELKIIDLNGKHQSLPSDKWIGTKDYWPPRENGKTPKEPQEKTSDIYAFGVLCEELKEKAEEVTLPESFQKLIDSCKELNPEKRPSIEDVIKKLGEMLAKPKDS